MNLAFKFFFFFYCKWQQRTPWLCATNLTGLRHYFFCTNSAHGNTETKATHVSVLWKQFWPHGLPEGDSGTFGGLGTIRSKLLLEVREIVLQLAHSGRLSFVPGNVPGTEASKSEWHSSCLQELTVWWRRAPVNGCLQNILVSAVIMVSHSMLWKYVLVLVMRGVYWKK